LNDATQPSASCEPLPFGKRRLASLQHALVLEYPPHPNGALRGAKYPSSHAHSYEPMVLTHRAELSHLCRQLDGVDSSHSFVSVTSICLV